MPERRREPRFYLDQPVPAQIRAADGSSAVIPVMATELSGGGLRVEVAVRHPLRPDQSVIVRLMHEDDEPELIEATVRRIEGNTLHLRADVLSHLGGDDPFVRAWSA